jgi:hypothetical protein
VDIGHNCPQQYLKKDLKGQEKKQLPDFFGIRCGHTPLEKRGKNFF